MPDTPLRLSHARSVYALHQPISVDLSAVVLQDDAWVHVWHRFSTVAGAPLVTCRHPLAKVDQWAKVARAITFTPQSPGTHFVMLTGVTLNADKITSTVFYTTAPFDVVASS